MVLPIVMYGCEICTIKKARHWRINVFELWCWRRFLRVPWTARRSNQSNLKEISPEYSSEGLMVKLKLQYFCHLMQRTDSFEKILMLGKIEGRRRRGWQRMILLDGITDLMNMSLSKLLELVEDREAWHVAVHGFARSRTCLSDWTELNIPQGNGTPRQYSCLENPMDRGVWWAAVHGVAKSWTRLNDWTELMDIPHFDYTFIIQGTPKLFPFFLYE